MSRFFMVHCVCLVRRQ